jgi:cobaltochelatase CobN
MKLLKLIAFILAFALFLNKNIFCQEKENANKTIGFLGIWDRSVPLIERAARENNISIVILKMEEAIKGNQIEKLNVLYLLNLDPALTPQLKERLEKLKNENTKLKVIALAHRDGQALLKNAKLLDIDKNIEPYWRANGLVNMRRLLKYTMITYFDDKGEIEPSVAVPDYGYYHPQSQDILNLDNLKKFANWNEGAPNAALLIQQSFWITQDTKVIEAQIFALEKEGFNVATVFADTTERMRTMLLEIKPNIIIEDRHGSIWEGDGKESLLSVLNVPYMRPISMLGYTIEDWLKDPRGLHVRDVGNFMTIQESKGTIEPLVIGGLKENIQGFRLHEAIPERIERFAKRAAAWVQMQTKKNNDKKVAIIYYNKSLGKDDVMRGSPTGAFLDGPESLFRFLPRLKSEGYDINNLPSSTKELLEWSMKRGKNIGPWAQGDLEALADQPGAVLVPLNQYEEWFNSKLSEKNKQEVIKNFGVPPGKFMVVTRNEKQFLVVPAVQFGNVIIAPQPERGEKQDEKLLHSRDVPPPHNYLAFYWWLQESFKADAVLHWGTHGSLELLPGKEAGLSKEDWSDICIGKMLIINPWIMDNLGEATLSRRRSYAVLIDHLVPPAVNSGLTDELQVIHDDIDKFEVLEQGLLREKFRRQITDGSIKSRIDTTIKIKDLKNRVLTDEEIGEVSEYLHELYNSTTPMTMHVLGMPPEEKYMVPYLVTILRKPFLDRLAEVYQVPKNEERTAAEKYVWLRNQAEKLVKETVLGDAKAPVNFEKDIAFAKDMRVKLSQADREITSILHALNGRYIAPGPGPEPVRNPASIPSGRNLYALNPEEIPTKASWEVAKLLVDEVLAKKLPKKVGIDLNGMNTMRDFGINEAQILYFMGVQPIWDSNGLVNDVELIPQDVLKRPRIDVFIAMGGMYKENFPTRVKLLDKAVRLVSSVDDKNNRVREGTLRKKEKLIEKGYSKEKVEQL